MTRINILEKVEQILKSLPDENKPWKKNGALTTNHFNFGFNEATWIKYSERMRLVNNPNSARLFQRSANNQPSVSIPSTSSLPPNSQVPSLVNVCSNGNVDICVSKSTPIEDLRTKILRRDISAEKQQNGRYIERLEYKSSNGEEHNLTYNSSDRRFNSNVKRNNKPGMYSDHYDDTKGYKYGRKTDNWQSDYDFELNSDEFKLKGRNLDSRSESTQNNLYKRRLERRTRNEYRAPPSASSEDDDDDDHRSRNKKLRKAYYEHDPRQNLNRERSQSNELKKKSENRRREEHQSETSRSHRDVKRKDSFSRNKRRRDS